MAEIKIGYYTSDYFGNSDRTQAAVTTGKAADGTGILNTGYICVQENLTGVKLGTWEFISGTTFLCRDFANIGNLDGSYGQWKVIADLSIDVETGDWLGSYSVGKIMTSSLIGRYFNNGDLFVKGENANLPSAYTSYGPSIYATGETVSTGGGFILI